MNRRVVLLVLLLADEDRVAAAAVLAGLSRVAPGRRVAVVDGQAQIRTLTPLTTARHLTGVPHLPAQVAAQGLYPRLGHHLHGVQIQLELDDRTPEGYLVACIWGDAATRTAADLGDHAAFAALDCPVEVQHYFLGDTTGRVWAGPPIPGSGISVQAWRNVDPELITDHVESTAQGRSPALRGAVSVDLNGNTEATIAQAKAAAHLFTDPDSRASALREVALAEAAAGHFAAARATLAEAHATWDDAGYLVFNGVEDLIEIALAEAASGVPGRAAATFAAAVVAAHDHYYPRDTASGLAAIARAEATAGNATESKAHFIDAKTTSFDTALDKVQWLMFIADAQNAAGQSSEARATFAEAKITADLELDYPGGERDLWLNEIALAEAAAGHIAEAKATTSYFDSPFTRAKLLTRIARAGATAGNTTDAAATLEEAKAIAHLDDDPQSRAWLLTDIAIAQATAGNTTDAAATLEDAKAIVDLIDPAGERAYQLVLIAGAEAAAGHTTAARVTFAEAKAVAQLDDDPQSRAWLLTKVAEVEEDVGLALDPTVNPPTTKTEAHLDEDVYGSTRDDSWALAKAPLGDATTTPHGEERAENGQSTETAEMSKQAPPRQPPMAEGTYRLTLRFGQPWSSGVHTGLDFAGPVGTHILAAASGTVVSAGYQGAYGNQIIIDHGDGYQTTYGHLSGIGVSIGDKVHTGDRIGRRGSTGNSTGANLHFEVKKDTEFIDPESWLGW